MPQLTALKPTKHLAVEAILEVARGKFHKVEAYRRPAFSAGVSTVERQQDVISELLAALGLLLEISVEDRRKITDLERRLAMLDDEVPQ